MPLTHMFLYKGIITLAGDFIASINSRCNGKWAKIGLERAAEIEPRDYPVMVQ